MWETVLFGALTILTFWRSLKRGASERACGAVVLMVWAAFTLVTLIAPHVTDAETAYRAQGEIGAALDALAGSAAVCVWAKWGRRLPLVLMALFILQVAVHRAQSGTADTYSHRLLAWATIDLINIAQLACVNFWTGAGDASSVFRRVHRRDRRGVRGGLVARVDDVVCKAGEWYNNRPVREKSR